MDECVGGEELKKKVNSVQFQLDLPELGNNITIV